MAYLEFRSLPRTCWQRQTAAVIPCLNEATTVHWLVPLVKEHVKTVCVVDDGSQDGTAREAERAGAHVIQHPTSRGKGTALRAGWNWARERGFSWVLSLDGDGQHAPADIPVFFRSVERSGAALTVGNRMTNPAKMPFSRRCVNRWMSRTLSLLARHDLPDSQCGFRLMSLEAFSMISPAATHFEIESEVLVAFLRAHQRVDFVPISVIYSSEKSKIRPIRDTIRWFCWLLSTQMRTVKAKSLIGISDAEPSIVDVQRGDLSDTLGTGPQASYSPIQRAANCFEQEGRRTRLLQENRSCSTQGVQP